MTRTIKARLRCMLSFLNVITYAALYSRDLAREFGTEFLIGALPSGWGENKDILPK